MILITMKWHFISDWLYQRCREGLEVRLEAISVVTELGTVCWAIEDEAAEWETAKTERLGLDVTSKEEVGRIYPIKHLISVAGRLSKIQINY